MSGAIVLGYDASPGAGKALNTAVELARRFGARLVIANGVDPPGTPGEETRAHRKALEGSAQNLMDNALDQARDAGVSTDIEIVPLRPAEALLQVAERHDARFIVVGGWGEGPLKGALLGSTAYKVLHLADRPVVVVQG